MNDKVSILMDHLRELEEYAIAYETNKTRLGIDAVKDKIKAIEEHFTTFPASTSAEEAISRAMFRIVLDKTKQTAERYDRELKAQGK